MSYEGMLTGIGMNKTVRFIVFKALMDLQF